MSWKAIEQQLTSLYGAEGARDLRAELEMLSVSTSGERANYELNEKSASLIVYANSVVDSTAGKSPLKSLEGFLQQDSLAEAFPVVHILPFYPWDTDRGFSVEDYYKVHPDYGTWDEVKEIANSVRLMFDFVANHASISNPLVQNSLIARHLDRDDARYERYKDYEDYVIAFECNDLPDESDIAALSRPRPASVLSPYVAYEDPDGFLKARLGKDVDEEEYLLGVGYVWTTFSREKNEDGTEATRQVDLNFKNPKVFLETVKILLFYCEKGADLIRLDAIGYLWKKLGSSSLHEPETHSLLAVLHKVLQQVAPDVISVAEVNEPQDRVLEYLGDSDSPESDLVYQFTHFPLAVHALQTEDSSYYRAWLDTLEPFQGKQFVTVLGSHDGLGMKPVRGLLPEEEIETFQKSLVEKHGGKPNFAKLPGGEEIIYEICGTPWDLIVGSDSPLSLELRCRKYLLVSALGLLPRGLPAFYINGVLGNSNYLPEEGLDENRTVNREVLTIQSIESELAKKDSRMRLVLDDLKHLLEARAKQVAFHPKAPLHQVIDIENKAVLAVYLPAEREKDSLLVVCNVSAELQEVSPFTAESFSSMEEKYQDVLSSEEFELISLKLQPFQVIWLRQ